MTDEEFLRPSREHLAHLNALIKDAESKMMQDIDRYGYGDREYAKQRSQEFYLSVEPLRREREAVVKVMTDWYGLQAQPTIITTVTDKLFETDETHETQATR